MRVQQRKQVLFGVLIGVILTLSLQVVAGIARDLSINVHSNEYKFQFDSIATLEIGAPVKQMGFDVGEVTKINVKRDKITKQNYIEVTVKVTDDAEISNDSQAYIQTLGMMGEKYLDVSFGQGLPATSESLLIGVTEYDIDSKIQNTAKLTKELLFNVHKK